MHVEFDDVRGEVRAGGVAVRCTPAGRAGEVRLGGDDGPVLAPVSFGERSAAAGEALRSARSREHLCGGLRARALRSPGLDPDVPAELVDCVVLALAGSDDDGVSPSFADAALGVLRATGGELSSLLDAPAREVDRLSAALITGAGAGVDDGWTRMVLAPAEPSLGEIRDRLADALVLRADAPAREDRPPAGWAGSAPTAVPDVAPDAGEDPAGRARVWPVDRAAGRAGAGGVASPSVASPSVASPSVASPSVASPSVASPSVASPSVAPGRVAPRGRVLAPPPSPGEPGGPLAPVGDAPPPPLAAVSVPPPAAPGPFRAVTDVAPGGPVAAAYGSAAAAQGQDHGGVASGALGWDIGRQVGGGVRASAGGARRDRDDALALDLADELGAALQDEADLRGLAR